MKLTLKPSTGKTIVVWRDRDTYCVRRAGVASEPEVCLAIDLFEVIAELAELDLDRDAEAGEAVRLAEAAQLRLSADGNDGNDSNDANDGDDGDEGNDDDSTAEEQQRSR